MNNLLKSIVFPALLLVTALLDHKANAQLIKNDFDWNSVLSQHQKPVTLDHPKAIKINGKKHVLTPYNGLYGEHDILEKVGQQLAKYDDHGLPVKSIVEQIFIVGNITYYEGLKAYETEILIDNKEMYLKMPEIPIGMHMAIFQVFLMDAFSMPDNREAKKIIDIMLEYSGNDVRLKAIRRFSRRFAWVLAGKYEENKGDHLVVSAMESMRRFYSPTDEFPTESVAVAP